MNYCDHCHVLWEDTQCPKCGSKFLLRPADTDYVFLAEKEYPWSEVLEQALRDAGIPVVTNDAVVGAWITTRLGACFERSQIFVPYGHLEQAADLTRSLFDDPEFVDFEAEDDELSQP